MKVVKLDLYKSTRTGRYFLVEDSPLKKYGVCLDGGSIVDLSGTIDGRQLILIAKNWRWKS